MNTPLIPSSMLSRSRKILFVAHLAIGDYCYLQNFLKAFAETYPSVKIHLWVDELRRTPEASKWEFLRRYSLYDWLECCPFIAKLYRETYSPGLLASSVREAVLQDYPIVVSLGTLRSYNYAELARQLSPRGHVVAIRGPVSPLALFSRLKFRKADALLPMPRNSRPVRHISSVYADWFRSLFGIEVPEKSRMPFVELGEGWRWHAERALDAWHFSASQRRGGRLVFLNIFAKHSKRCWTLEKAAGLIMELRSRPGWQHSHFILNTVPEQLARTSDFVARQGMERVRVFSASENFFELPAIMAECDLVISVETAVMHLANAVRVPVVALMRQKNPEWAPIDTANSEVVLTLRRRDHVSNISVRAVREAVEAFLGTEQPVLHESERAGTRGLPLALTGSA